MTVVAATMVAVAEVLLVVLAEIAACGSFFYCFAVAAALVAAVAAMTAVDANFFSN